MHMKIRAFIPTETAFFEFLLPQLCFLIYFSTHPPRHTHTFANWRKGTGSWKLPMDSGSPRCQNGAVLRVWCLGSALQAGVPFWCGPFIF